MFFPWFFSFCLVSRWYLLDTILVSSSIRVVGEMAQESDDDPSFTASGEPSEQDSASSSKRPRERSEVSSGQRGLIDESDSSEEEIALETAFYKIYPSRFRETNAQKIKADTGIPPSFHIVVPFASDHPYRPLPTGLCFYTA